MMDWKLFCVALCLFAFAVQHSLHCKDAIAQENAGENREIIKHFLQ